MFTPKTDRLRELGKRFPNRLTELETIFDKETNVYIDYANVRPWSSKLGWHVDVRRLKQLLGCFSTIHEVKLYTGTLLGDAESQDFIGAARRFGYQVITKPVKIMKLSIDVSSIPSDSPAILKSFIRPTLLQQLKVETIERLNNELRQLNAQGMFFIEDRKCNFDVEIGRDMLLDYAGDGVETFILWSGDSDFADPIRQLLVDGKDVVLFATARRVSKELDELRPRGLHIFDIQKIRNFICWPKEIEPA